MNPQHSSFVDSLGAGTLIFTALLAVIVLLCALGPRVRAASPASLEERVRDAGKSLSHGGIIAARQREGEAPTVVVAGTLEPIGVPAEQVIFEIGSVSKVFTGLLLAQAVIEKKVTLDSTLRELMGPGQSFADDRVAAITLRQLATHRSGLPRLPMDIIEGADLMDPYAHYDRARLNACVAAVKLAKEPPYPAAYSNFGAGLLGDLLARLYNSTWEKLVVEKITGPLGMVDTCINLSDEQERRLAPAYSGALPVKRWRFQALAGAGALYSTTADMLRFGGALSHPEKTSLEAAIRMIQQRQQDHRYGLCLMLSLNQKTIYWFQGGTGGYRSWISANPATGEVISLLINNAVLDAEDVLFEKEAAPAAGQPDPALAPYTGQYDTGVEAEGVTIYYTFVVRGAQLWMQITGQPFIPLTRHPSVKDRFEYKPVKAELQFSRKDEKVVSTTLFQDGLEIHAKRLPAGDAR